MTTFDWRGRFEGEDEGSLLSARTGPLNSIAASLGLAGAVVLLVPTRRTAPFESVELLGARQKHLKRRPGRSIVVVVAGLVRADDLLPEVVGNTAVSRKGDDQLAGPGHGSTAEARTRHGGARVC